MRLDYKEICALVTTPGKIIDLGCGSGELLAHIVEHRRCQGTGIELNPLRLQEAMSKGVSVLQGDFEEMIKSYPDKHFDYCILSQTIQELKDPDNTIREMLRISKKVLISFVNLAHWTYRLNLVFRGKIPQSKDQNIRIGLNSLRFSFLSVQDFRNYCKLRNIAISNEIFLGKTKKVNLWPNIQAYYCIFEVETV